MNRTDRLLGIVLELQGRDRVTADDLARTFEVTKRTIYRDIQALAESGVPVVSAPGQGYWLMEGYFLPPVSLTTDEAVMLVLGSAVMAASFDAQYQGAATTAQRKIEAVLSPDVRREVAYLRDNIRFISQGSRVLADVPGMVQVVRRAIVARRTLLLRYIKRTGGYAGEVTERRVDPHGLVHLNGAWLLSAYCHLRRDMRVFRLERAQQLTVLPDTFTRQPGFDLMAGHEPTPKVYVVLLFAPDVAQWVRERPVFHDSLFEDTPDGLRVTLGVRHPDDALFWVLSWGKKVRVLSPASLRDRLREELEAMRLELDSEVHASARDP